FIGGNDVPVLVPKAGTIETGMKLINDEDSFDIAIQNISDFANVSINYDFTDALETTDKTIAYGSSVNYSELFTLNTSLPSGEDAWKADFVNLILDPSAGSVSPPVTTVYIADLSVSPKTNADKAVVVPPVQAKRQQYSATVFVNFSVTANLTNASLDGKLFVPSDEAYKGTIVPEAGYLMPESIVVKVGGDTLSSDEYTFDSETGEIFIPKAVITDNIVITAIAGKTEYTLHFSYEEGIVPKDKEFTYYPDDDISDALSWADNYAASLPQEDGYTFSWDWNTEDDLPLEKMPASDWWVFGKYRPNEYKLTINYVDEDENPIAEPYEMDLWHGYEYAIVSPNISGYTPDNPVVSGTLSDNTVITVEYSKTFNTLTIFYIYSDTNTEITANRYSQVYNTGDPYSVASPAVSGYTPNISVVLGNMTAEGVTVYVYYNPNTYTITFDANGGTAGVTEKNVVYNDVYGYDADLDEYTGLPTPIRTGYKFTGWYDSSDNLITEETLFESTEDVTLTAKWEAYEFKLIINYKYKDGTQAAESHISDVAYETVYSVNSPTIPGFMPDIPVVTGTMPGAAKVIDVIYDEVSYNLTIHYQYSDKTEAAPSYSENYKYGDEYEVLSPEIDDYVASITTVSGTMGEEDRTVVVTYYSIDEYISVDIEWGDLIFSYATGTWNPEELRYENGQYKKESENSDKIIITNHSAKGVTATPTYSSYEGHENVDVDFVDGDKISITSVHLNEGFYGPQSENVYVVLSGDYYDSRDNSFYSGEITITITGD
ncbi:MAG TPA: MucBP domain-containing protein, partial [Oscillospiraceae bacterium]|nr:MucBP domain-containing protein [Oscillospiraceae bacterium]